MVVNERSNLYKSKPALGSEPDSKPSLLSATVKGTWDSGSRRQRRWPPLSAQPSLLQSSAYCPFEEATGARTLAIHTRCQQRRVESAGALLFAYVKSPNPACPSLEPPGPA